MQFDPINTTLKAPGIKLLKLKCDKPLAKFSFKFSLHCYTKVDPARLLPAAPLSLPPPELAATIGLLSAVHGVRQQPSGHNSGGGGGWGLADIARHIINTHI